ncbi:ComF family protein [Thermosediminibacter oceani]|uniref:Phosphoribosyltransferase n=1 Tax=Thermosediminibacter oceani (strain ATCC BAA-1034 / DSM 16646 / JW/IW-1228P) TaxID=555079 RepID=D9RYB7_THEOJ|nr:ComF family protein [Thermosediminibacter oceani]ADL08341.1 phosphoribosyltransferase [Thermosediminibacter oceani DSM 16646]
MLYVGIKKITGFLLDALFPESPFCAVCGSRLPQGERLLCGSCRDRMEPISQPFCLKCGRPLYCENAVCADCSDKNRYFVGARAWGVYRGVLKQVIHLYKYRGERRLSYLLGLKMLEALERQNWPSFDYLAPVPLHPKRERERGFNQSLLLADVISSKTGIPVFKGLIRARPTEHQTFLEKSSRETNVAGAFAVKDGSAIKEKTLLLIDDVYTTGSTADECSKALLQAGASGVYVLTAARG